MKLKDMDNLFGISLSIIKTQARKYKASKILCWVVDISLITVACVLLYKTGQPTVYVQIAVLIALIMNVMLMAMVSNEHIQAVYFYNRFKNSKVDKKTYSVDADKLFSVLFCAGYKGIKAEQSLDTYKSAIDSACLLRNKYSKKIYKLLSKYEDVNGNYTAYVLEKGYYLCERSKENE